jgi:hypothetical protein
MQIEQNARTPEELRAELYAIVNRMLEPYGKSMEAAEHRNALMAIQYPFDITRPAQHATKAEFDVEFEAVQTAYESVSTLLHTLLPDDTEEAKGVMAGRLGQEIDGKARRNAPRSELNDSLKLLRKNAAELGFYSSSLWILVDLQRCLSERYLELQEQKNDFWNVPHRAPDYYARAIALRLARLFAQKTKEKPTYGVSGDFGEPSTTYSRALREVFAALDINAQDRGYAEWAVSQIEDSDMTEVSDGLMSALMGTTESGDAHRQTEVMRLRKAAKRSDQ